MNPSRRSLCLLPAALVVPPARAQPRTLRMVASPLPPYVLEPGHRRGGGLDVDVAREALARVGASLQVELVPWRRALAMLELGQADFAAGVHDTPERRRFLAFSQPYGETVRYGIYTRRGSGVTVAGLRDLQGLHLGLAAASEFADDLKAAMTGPIDRGTDLAATLRMLAAGRVQAVVGNELTLRWLARELGLSGALQREPYRHDSGRPTQMAFSRRRPDHADCVVAMNRGLSLLARDGRPAALEARYLAD